MAKIAFIYSTVDGHTVTICERLMDIAKSAGHAATMLELTPDTALGLEEFDRVVLGASIRYGKHRPAVLQFVRDNLDVLKRKNGAFFPSMQSHENLRREVRRRIPT